MLSHSLSHASLSSWELGLSVLFTIVAPVPNTRSPNYFHAFNQHESTCYVPGTILFNKDSSKQVRGLVLMEPDFLKGSRLTDANR